MTDVAWGHHGCKTYRGLSGWVQPFEPHRRKWTT